MRKILAVLMVTGVAFCCTQSADAQVAKRLTVSNVVQPQVPTAVPAATLDFSATQPNVDPALLAATGVRVGLESGMLNSRGVSQAPTAGPFGPPCQVTCVGTAEVEACGSDSNGGCTLDFCMTPGFEAIASGQTICGTVFADMGVRDLDYYALAVPAGPSLVTLTFESEFEGQVFLIEAGGAGAECSGSIVLETDFSDSCTPVTIIRSIAAQQYYIAVTTGNATGPIFDGVTCAAGNNQYRLSLTVAGADCLTCVGTTEADPCGIMPDTNIGCNAAMAPFPFSMGGAIGAAPTTLCGNSSNDGMARDTDWWEITLPAGSNDVTIEFTSEFPGVMFLLNDQMSDCVTNVVVVQTLFSGGCIPSTATIQAAGGGTNRYLLFVSTGDQNGPLFTGVPCGNTNDYSIEVSAVPAVCPPNCVVNCVGTPEGEVCPATPMTPDMTNGGCNSPNNAFGTIAVDGGPVCGISWADSGTRDTDWYKFTVASNQTVTLTINSSVPVDFFLLNESNGNGGALNVPCNLGVVNVVANGNHPGNCMPISLPGIALTIDPVLGQRDYVVFVGPATPGGVLFSGFPCVCDFPYSIEISTAATPACNIPTGTVDSDCATGSVTLNLVAGSAYTAAGLTVDITGFGDAAGFTQQLTIPGPFMAGAPITQVIMPPLAAGDYTFDITGDCTAGGSFAAVAAIGHYPYNGETDLIFAGEFDGCIDSVAAIEAALAANGRSSLTINNQVVLISDYDCLTSAGVETIWVALGTFPNNVPIVAAEGTALLNAVLTSDISVYLEGADVWGFDAPTDFFEVDGVEGTLLDGTIILDGDDSLAGLTGVASPISTASAAYNQDNLNATQFGGDDFTDQLIASAGTDQPVGSTHSVIFTETTALYGVAIASEGPNDTTGKVISSSFEFGGYAGDQTALMGEYLGFLKDLSVVVNFRRGDCNNDGGINIADAIYLLGALFPGPMGPNVINCEDACDANDDGGRNIADAIALLASLFGSPPVMLPAPGSVCGADPTTMDVFGCAMPTCP